MFLAYISRVRFKISRKPSPLVDSFQLLSETKGWTHLTELLGMGLHVNFESVARNVPLYDVLRDQQFLEQIDELPKIFLQA